MPETDKKDNTLADEAGNTDRYRDDAIKAMIKAGERELPSASPFEQACYSLGVLEKLKKNDYQNRKSPLPVWSYLRTSFWLNSALKEKLPDRKHEIFLAPLPHWICKYLCECAFNIMYMANSGRLPWGDSAEPTSAEGALSALPRIFGFSRQGYNAFREFKTEWEDEILLYMAEVGDESGPATKSARLAKIAELLGHSDDRALRRRLQKHVRYKGNLYEMAGLSKKARRVKPPPEV